MSGSSAAAAPRPLTLRELIAANRGIFTTFTLYSAALFACTFASFFAARSDSVAGASARPGRRRSGRARG